LNGLIQLKRVGDSEEFYKEMEERKLISEYTLDFYIGCLSSKGLYEKADFYKTKHKRF
jgi:pentatricopeptide repeat protein